jgi:hypothetical protein
MEKRTLISPERPGGAHHTLRHWLLAFGLLAVLTLVMFADVLFNPKPVVLSHRGCDLSKQFIHWLTFGFGELARGNLALWNPHVFSGAPFLGGFQSALLYPPNALFLWLPLDEAINWSIALHVFLAGAFTYAWAARRGLRPPACFLAAVVFMFCGAFFLHIYAGHYPHICTMIWAPLLFLAIDGLYERPSLGWSLLGMFAMAMQVLAGFPQYVFHTGVAAAIYCVLNLFRAGNRKGFLLGLAGIVAGGVALSAVQLLTSFQESREMLRSVGLPYNFAAIFSFPPENFLTLLVPDIFGDIKTLPYWGRCYLWEVSLFIGVSGFMLAILGGVCGERRTRRFSIVMVVLLLLLALGSHTPLFKALYLWVPGFDKFRGISKFTLLASLFLAMLAGIGLDELVKGRRPPRALIWGGTIAGFLLLVAAATVELPFPGAITEARWQSFMLGIRGTGETYLAPEAYEDSAFALLAQLAAARSLLMGGAMVIVATVLLLMCARRQRLGVWLLLTMAVAEPFVFARKSLDHFDPGQTVNPDVKQFLEAHPGDYRIVDLSEPNNMLMSMGAQDIWGYDAGIVLRYAQLLALTQNVEPDKVTQNLTFTYDDPLLGMFRCRFISKQRGGQELVAERTNCLPHLLLIQQYRVVTGREEIFGALTNAAFNPGKEVILESAPEVQPTNAREAGTASIIDSSTDYLTIKADVKSPAILLITDVYAKGWRARALPGSSQQHYQVMPADYCLRAIPLAAGEHSLRVEYLPSGFLIGRVVSLIALLVFTGLMVGWVWRRSLSFRRLDPKTS